MNRKPLREITPDDIRAYEDDGVVCLRQLFDGDWVTRMHQAVLRYMDSDVGAHRVREARLPGEDARFYINSFMSVYDPEFVAFRDHSPAAEIGATLMGVDEVRFWYDQMFVKDAGTGAPTQWHQDLPFWPFRGSHLVSIWLALTPATSETSGLQYVAGSHRWGKFYCPVTPDEDAAFTDPALEPCPDFSQRQDDPSLRFLSWDVEPGDCICHHPLAVHGAGGNASGTMQRAALSIRYLGEDVRWDKRPHVMTLPEWPDLPNGVYPSDDALFPVIWRRDAAAA
jgi:ectoine hydroxylase-related dioxygenase (phytanoyl-CoA dioxygenase family)